MSILAETRELTSLESEAAYYEALQARHDALPFEDEDWDDEHTWAPSLDDERWLIESRRAEPDLEEELAAEVTYPWERTEAQVNEDLDRNFEAWLATLRDQGRLTEDGRISDLDHAIATGCV